MIRADFKLIIADFADPKTARTLTLLAKTLQCLANLANFGVKEPYMVEMNSFIMVRFRID